MFTRKRNHLREEQTLGLGELYRFAICSFTYPTTGPECFSEYLRHSDVQLQKGGAAPGCSASVETVGVRWSWHGGEGEGAMLSGVKTALLD